MLKNTNQLKENMKIIKEVIEYLDDNQNKIDNEISDDKKAKDIFQDIEDLKNKLEQLT